MFGTLVKTNLPFFLMVLCSFVFLPTNTVSGALVNTTTQLSKKATVKQEKRIKRIKKKLEAMPSKTKGILALVAGILTLAAVWFSIALSFAGSAPGVIVAIILTALLGTAAVILGIQAIKENDGGKVLGLVGLIVGGVGLLMLIGLTLGNLFFS